jgi:hypothetical protein
VCVCDQQYDETELSTFVCREIKLNAMLHHARSFRHSYVNTDLILVKQICTLGTVRYPFSSCVPRAPGLGNQMCSFCDSHSICRLLYDID